MHISLSTVFMAVFATAILMTLLYFCLSDQRLMVRVGYKLLALFVMFTALRFALPFEFPFTTNIRLPRILSDAVFIFYRELLTLYGQKITLWWILKNIWLIGAVIGIARYIFIVCRASYFIVLFGKELTNASPYRELVENICQKYKRSNRFRVIELPGLDSPMLYGIFFPKILIPEHTELTDEQFRYILQHEMTHHFHHDLLLKSLVKLLTLIYWWYPICGRLNKRVEVVLEMHVDDVLTVSDPTYTSEYLHCLLDYFSDRKNETPIASYLGMSLLPEKTSDINKRFRLLTHNQNKINVALSALLYALMIGIYLSSYSFILEASTPPQNTDLMYDDIKSINAYNTTYFIDNGDGTYDFYTNGTFLETTDSIEYYPPGTPIYTPENNPYQ